MPIDARKFGEDIVAEFMKEYNNDISDDLSRTVLNIAADAAAIAIKLYEEQSSK